MKVEHNSTLSWASTLPLIQLDSILPVNHAKIGLIGEFSDQPVIHFVLEQISHSLAQRPWEEDAVASPITTLEGYGDPAAAAEKLVAKFETLPWHYELFIETPLTSDFSEFFGQSFELGRGVTLFLADETYVNTHNLPVNNPLLWALSRRQIPGAWSADCYYLKADVDGFIGRFSSRQAILNFISKAKSLAGVLLALDIVDVERSPFAQLNRKPILQYHLDPHPTTEDAGWLSDEDAYTLQRLKVFPQAKLTTDQERARRTPVRLLEPAFRSDEDRLVNAARWYFDSFSGGNELLSFVQAMVVLEILFGDKASSDVIGIGQLIANRCAYLIGKTAGHRNKIIGDITRIYATRSAIVHRGKDRLTPTEENDFQILRRLCRSSIRQELEVAYRGIQDQGLISRPPPPSRSRS